MLRKMYIFKSSPAARAALITANAVSLSFDVHTFKSIEELYAPDMLKINPQHTVPFLNDNGKIIGDSHAISAYLVDKYGVDDSLYPKELYQRSTINQRMFYDASVMYPALKEIIGGFLKKKFKTVPNAKKQHLEDMFTTLEKYLDGNKWIAGNHVSIADFSCGTTTSSLEFVCPIDKKAYPKVDDWLNRVQKLSYLKNDTEQFEHFKKFVFSILTWD